MSNLSDDPAIKARLAELASLTGCRSVADMQNSPIAVDALLDTLVGIYKEVKSGEPKNKYTAKFLEKFGPLLESVISLRLRATDFDVIKDLAKGAFGRDAHKVSLVRERNSNQLYALKSLKKAQAIGGQENLFYEEERRVMASIDSTWITKLHASFQDEQSLYLVMEYVPGGDLCRVLEDQGLIESEGRFYIVQTICAIEQLHRMGYVHRDIKPHNILIDRSGHIKLADFGSCIRLDEKEQITSVVSVGTPDYIAPEVLRSQEGKSSYETPFYNDSVMFTYSMIIDHKKHLRFPLDTDVSEDAIDLTKRLLTEQEDRLGTQSVEEIKSHPWFEGIDWTNPRSLQPPFVPELLDNSDTRYFPDQEDDDVEFAYKEKDKRDNVMNFLPFIGYTYVRDNGTGADISTTIPNGDPTALEAIAPADITPKPLPQLRFPNVSRNDSYLGQIVKLEAENQQKNSECGELKELLFNKDKLLDETKAMVVDLNDRIVHQEGKLKSSLAREAVYNSSEKQKAVMELECKELQMRLETIEQEKSELRKTLSSIQYAIEKESRHTATLTETIKKLEETKTRSEKEIASVREDHKSQVALSTIQRLRVSELAKEKLLLELEVDSLKQRYSAKEEEAQVTRGSIGGRIEELEKIRNTLTIQISELSEKCRLQEEEDHTLRNSIILLKQQLSESQEEIVTLQRAREEAMNAHDLICRERETLMAQIQTLTIDMQTLRRDLEQEQRALLQKETELASFKSMVFSDVEEHVRKTLDLEQALFHRDTVITELQGSVQESKDLRAELSQLKIEYDKLDKSLALYMQHASLQSSSDKSDKRLKHENRELKALVVAKDNRITELEREISDFKIAKEQIISRHSNASLSSSPIASPMSPMIVEGSSPIVNSPTTGSLQRKGTIANWFGRKKSRPPTKMDKDFTGAYYRGYIKLLAQPDKGIKHGWRKRYLVIKENQVLAFDKEKEYLSNEGGQALFSLTAEILLVRSPHYDDVHHANKSDKPFIFAVVACISVLDHVRELTRKVEIEENYREAAKKLYESAFSPVQQKETQNKLQECNCNLAKYTLELEFYKTLAYMRDTSPSEADGLLKFNSVGVVVDGKGIDTPKEMTDRRPSVFEPLKPTSDADWAEDVEKLRTLHIGEVYECHGHHLRGEQFTKAINCHYCGDTIFGNRTPGLHCEGCHFACHRYCLNYIFQFRCSQYKVLHGAKPIYFLAENLDDKKAWISILQTLRKQYEAFRLLGSGASGGASALSITSSDTSAGGLSPRKGSVLSV